VTARKKILHYCQLYIDRPDPIAFMTLAVDKSDRFYDDFLRLLFLHVHSETSVLVNDIPQESSHFRFLDVACLASIKGSVGLILAKTSTMRISIPLDSSSRSFIPPPRFILSNRSTIV
jgi:hypothetical protein